MGQQHADHAEGNDDIQKHLVWGKETLEENRGGIFGRSWDKNLKNFAPCYSQSPPPADFTPPYGFLGLEISTATAENQSIKKIQVCS